MTIAAATAASEHGQAALTLDGAETLTIAPGEEAACDPMDVPVARGADLVLSLYFPEETGLATYSNMPMQTAHIVGGNHVTSPALPAAEQVETRFYVSGVDVLTPDDTAIAGMSGEPPATSDALIEGFKALAHRAHQADLKILTPPSAPSRAPSTPGSAPPRAWPPDAR